MFYSKIPTELQSKRASCDQSTIEFEGDSTNCEPYTDQLWTQSCEGLNSSVEELKTVELLQIIKEHEEYLESCKENNRLNEAEKIYKKIRKFKQEVALSWKKELEGRHQEERDKLEQMQNAEMEELLIFWEERIQNYKMEAQAQIDNTIEKYKYDHLELKEGLEASLSQKVVVNPQRLIYQKIIGTLVKKREFQEAKHFKNRCVDLEKQDMEKTMESRDNKMKTAANQLMYKQMNELSCLKAKIATGLVNLNRIQKDECERLRLKFQHMQKQVAKAQAQELTKLEALLKNYVPSEKRRFEPKAKAFNDKLRLSINLKDEPIVMTSACCSPSQGTTKRKVNSILTEKDLAHRRSMNVTRARSPQYVKRV